MSKSVGIIGARGYVGRELLKLINMHDQLTLDYASSREWDGKPISDMLEEHNDAFSGKAFEALTHEAAAARGADIVFMGLPNEKSAPFVEAIDHVSPESIIIDLSSDHRHEHDWVYGLPERNRQQLVGATRIANPGCYATAAQLAIKPLTEFWQGPVHVFGLSGYSGAGTSPSRKNDPEALANNAIPYGLIGHGHEREIAEHAGLDVRFSPTVANFFRGLVTVISGSLNAPMGQEDIISLFEAVYDAEPFTTLMDIPAEPAAAANQYGCLIGQPVISEDGRRAVVTASIDNLLKGAASQAVQNLNIALGWPEDRGLMLPK